SAEAHRKFYDEYNAVLDMDADYYLETIETVFQEYKLVNGTWDVRSPEGKVERVRPQDITTTALFTVEGELDDISGSGQTEAAHDLCTGIVRKEQRHLEAKGAGHYGIFSGRRWREIVYPEVRKFILSHEVPQKKAPRPAAVTEMPDDNPPAPPRKAAATKAVAKKVPAKAAVKAAAPATGAAAAPEPEAPVAKAAVTAAPASRTRRTTAARKA
ncbi:MAG: polyhydroxyalkanoate depolymerase, partial [Acidovorax sp.]